VTYPGPKEVEDLISERDFLADQVSKLESVIDDKQDTVDKLTATVDELKAMAKASAEYHATKQIQLKEENTQLKKDRDFLLGALTYIAIGG